MKITKDKRNGLLIECKRPDGGTEYSYMSEYVFNELKSVMFGPIFDKLCAVQKLAWDGDDIMDQETLFELQDKLAEISLSFASKISPQKVDKLVEQFPWLYTVKE